METTKSRRTAKTTIEDLTDDLTVEILSKLPRNSIVLYLGVCKRWQSLIRNGPFLLTNIIYAGYRFSDEKYMCLRRGQNMCLRRGQSGGGKQTSDLSFSIKFSGISPYRYRILASCNGLLFSGVFTCPRAGLHRYFICNPWTKEFLPLQKPTNFIGFLTCGLAFENSSINSNSRDNSSSSSNNVALFKIVVVNKTLDHTYRFEVYSSDGKRWKLLEWASERGGDPLLAENAVYCNQVLYWLCYNRQYEWDHALMFNLETETPGYLDLPSDDGARAVGYRLTECDGQLHFIRISSTSGRLSIWKMLTRRDEWLILHNVDLRGAVERNLKVLPQDCRSKRKFPVFEPIDMNCLGDDKVLLYYNYDSIVSYDLKSAEFELVLRNVCNSKWMFFRYSPTNKSISERLWDPMDDLITDLARSYGRTWPGYPRGQAHPGFLISEAHYPHDPVTLGVMSIVLETGNTRCLS